MFSKFDVIETIDMVEKEHLDIRTVTMGISLLSCIRGSAEETAQAVYDRVMKKGGTPRSDRRGALPRIRHPDRQQARLGDARLPHHGGVPRTKRLVGKALDRAAKELASTFWADIPRSCRRARRTMKKSS